MSLNAWRTILSTMGILAFALVGMLLVYLLTPEETVKVTDLTTSPPVTPGVIVEGEWDLPPTDVQWAIICQPGYTLNDAGDGCEPLPPWWEFLPACSEDSFVPWDTHPCLWRGDIQGNGHGDTVVIFADESSAVIHG